MSLLPVLIVFLALLSLAASTSVPSTSSIDSDITLLYYNDVDVYTTSKHQSVLLLSAKSQPEATTACASLGESFLSVNQTFFTTELATLLQYQTYEGRYGETQLYWVASNGDACQAVDVAGQVAAVSCNMELPTLCTQSSAYGASADSSNSLIVYADDLMVTGYRDQRSFRFEGVPYVDPFERFTYSTAYTGSKILNATSFGSMCIQTGLPSGSENCLFLNIWTPYIPLNGSTASSNSLKPVMFWIHGGAYTSGSGSDSIFYGSNMASRGDIVVVTINYRLSTLGFLALDDGVTNGNFGLADQIAALDWVQTYISAFGGDPTRITIAGQSAGASSVRALLGSPPAIGKYAAVISMSNLAGSNYATTYSEYMTIPEEVAIVVDPLLAEAGCNSSDALSCLRAVDAYDLVTMTNVARFVVVDGTYVTSQELPLNGSGTVANVHTMWGYMRDDGAAFIGYPTSDNLTTALSSQDLPTNVVGNSLFSVPTGPNATLDVYNVTARVSSDTMFRCLDQATAYSAIEHDLFQSVWFYQFNRSYQITAFDPNWPVCDAPVTASHPYGDPSQEYFKCHCGELYYVFGTLPNTLPYRDDQDLPFMQQMVDVWTSFVRTYDPNPDKAFLSARGYNTTLAMFEQESAWEAVSSQTLTNAPLRTLQWQSFMGAFAEQEQCEFLGYPLDYYG
ncbi:carboxylesterase from carbohydrate esterase [Laetiporus sulphureus 93-53]|uniref:Carboxylic ester hydrolase n=1 Tax=Laetiporus sulphureus 93-53 TaxID=1314785 RepID=A0A165DBF1_9APHY|nr:carboxylesterase from carbohydrate esterase [Laetiporus sulphureus 93-53]KZT04484.1 carboxylesterase from carbohydrate esterase [Laetiporus sulphureus 93-53]